MNRTFAFLAVTLVAAALCGPARADVLMPPPKDCPAGSIGRTSHSGPHCAPRTCERGCEEGLACKSVDLCILQRQGANRVRRFTFDVVLGPCRADRTCAEGACQTREVCVPGAPPVAPSPASPDASAAPAADAALESAPPDATAAGPAPAGPDAQVLEDKKLGTETRKPAACSTGSGDTAGALALAALLTSITLRRRTKA